MAEDDFDPKAWLKERQQQKKEMPPEVPKPDFDPGAWLRERGTPGALSAAPPQTVQGAPDWAGKYRPGLVKGAEQAVVESGTTFTRGAQAVRGIPYAGAAIAQFPLTRPLFDIAKSVSPEQQEKAEKFANEPYTLPGQQLGYWAGKAGELALPAGPIPEYRAALDLAGKMIATEGAWHAAQYLAHTVLPPGLGSAPLMWRLIKHFGWAPFRKFLEETKNVTADVKAIREELQGAKAGGTFIPKTAESTGTKAAKTQAKFSTPLKKLPYAEEAEPLEGSYEAITPRGKK